MKTQRLWLLPEILGGKQDNGSFSDSFISKKQKLILFDLIKFNGLTPYFAIKSISKKRNLASSTIKYNLKKLRVKQILGCRGKIEITEKGFFLIKLIGELDGNFKN